MKYKVFVYRGTELGLKTHVERGQAWLDSTGVHIEGPDGFTIPNDDIVEAELFRLHGLGRVIRLDYRGGRVFLSVVRLMIGQFSHSLTSSRRVRSIASWPPSPSPQLFVDGWCKISITLRVRFATQSV